MIFIPENLVDLIKDFLKAQYTRFKNLFKNVDYEDFELDPKLKHYIEKDDKDDFVPGT